MTPTPIVVPLTSPGTPVTFVLNGTGELEIKSVQATVDGSAAATQFDAVLSIYTQDDKLISRTKPSSSIVAGASAIVTWAPFLGKKATASTGAGLATLFQVTMANQQAVPSGNNDDIVWNRTIYNSSGAFTTADNITFTLAKGLWLLSCRMYLNITFFDTTNTATQFNLLNNNSIFLGTQVWLDGIANGGGNIAPQVTTLLDGSVTAITLKTQFHNFETGTVNILAPQNASYLMGVLLIPA